MYLLFSCSIMLPCNIRINILIIPNVVSFLDCSAALQHQVFPWKTTVWLFLIIVSEIKAKISNIWHIKILDCLLLRE